MIDFFCERLRANPDAARLLADARSQASPARDALLPMMHPHDDAQSASHA
jgi:hypothetical protein